VEEKEKAEENGQRMAALEEKAEQQNGGIAILQSELGRLTTNFGGIAGEVSTLRSTFLKHHFTQILAVS
jgi:hypothetical protein